MILAVNTYDTHNYATFKHIPTSSPFLCASFLGGKSTNFLPMQWSIVPRNWETYENASNLPGTKCPDHRADLIDLMLSIHVHTCVTWLCKPSMHNINAVYMPSVAEHSLNVQKAWQKRANQECSVRSQLHFSSSLSRYLHIFTLCLCFIDILHHHTSPRSM